MPLSPWIVLLAWIPLGIALFYRLPVRVAILVNFLGGWAVLPGASYQATNDPFPYWFMGVCLPTSYFLTKATAIGISALAGVALFHLPDLRNFRPGLLDFPMLLWCLVPTLSAFTHWNTLRQGLSASLYQALAWGVPWFLGRIYFSTEAPLLLAVRAYLTVALLYVPICLAETAFGPHLYSFLYGYQPYQNIGAERYFGFRPIGLMEDGNQLGIWMAGAALISISVAVSVAAHRGVPPTLSRILGIQIGWVAAVLALTTVLCQSAGSILLLLLLLPLTIFKRRAILQLSAAAVILLVVAFAALRITNAVSLRSLAEHNPFFHAVARGLADAGRQSFSWRLARDEGHIHVALEHPFLVSGLWDWWRNGTARPWSLWLLILGMYGAVGLTAFAGILFPPIVRTIWSDDPEHAGNRRSVRIALVGLILMVAIDDLLNGAMILPYLLFLGALCSFQPSLPSSSEPPSA